MAAAQTMIQVRTIDLGDQQMLMLDHCAGARLQVLAGGIWLTEPDVWDDRFARSGDQVRLRSSRRVLVQALGSARLRLSQAMARRGRPALRAAWLKAKDRLVMSTLAGSLALVVGLGVLELAADAFLNDSTATAAQTLAGSLPAASERTAGS